MHFEENRLHFDAGDIFEASNIFTLRAVGATATKESGTAESRQKAKDRFIKKDPARTQVFGRDSAAAIIGACQRAIDDPEGLLPDTLDWAAQVVEAAAASEVKEDVAINSPRMPRGIGGISLKGIFGVG